MRKLLMNGVITIFVIAIAFPFSPVISSAEKEVDLATIQDMLPSSKMIIVNRTEIYIDNNTFDTITLIMDYIAENEASWSREERYSIAEKITTEAYKYGLDPLLVAATIRVESRFKNNTTSSANAQGMMQIIPPTAKYIAKQIGLEDYDLNDYNDSIEIGCWYLAKSIVAYNGSISRSHPRTGVELTNTDMGVLAYNGGTRIASTLRNIEYLDLVDKQYTELKQRMNNL
jgi:soluble lytic murein transglycosylase-like protein